MTRNQKIALGCGGAGCLGLIVLLIAGCLVFYFYSRESLTARRGEWNFNANRNSNLNSNTNDNDNANDDSSSNSSSSTSASSFSDDEKHKLFQAASVAGDGELLRRVLVKIGLTKEDFTPNAEYDQFVSDHISWGGRNYEFIMTINTPEKARAYVNEHLR